MNLQNHFFIFGNLKEVNVQTELEIIGSIFLVLQIVCIYLIISKKLHTLKKISMGVSVASKIVAIIFCAEVLFFTHNLYLGLLGFTMMFYSSYIVNKIKKQISNNNNNINKNGSNVKID